MYKRINTNTTTADGDYGSFLAIYIFWDLLKVQEIHWKMNDNCPQSTFDFRMTLLSINHPGAADGRMP